MPKLVCTSCGHVGEPTTVTKGSIGMELVMWLCFIIPGVIYSMWRLSSRHDACPSCAQTTLIPAQSLMAQKFLRENLPEQLALAEEPRYIPSKKAQAAGRALGHWVGRVFK